jgi:hypothetical protein
MMEVNPSKVLYIKLGEKGKWEKECIEGEEQILKVGYREVDHNLCINGKWSEVREVYLKSGEKEAVATGFANRIQDFYEAGDDVLWITFYASRLWWCFSKREVTQLPEGDKKRPVIGKWKCRNIKGEPLLFDRLSGSLISLQAFRGTICQVHESEYVKKRINGIESDEVKEAKNALDTLEKKLEVIIRTLHWKDFEALIDLIFRQAGWQRLSLIGEEQKTFDLDLRCPITGNRYLAQVKSEANKKNLDDYKEKCKEMPKDYEKFYFIVHSPLSDLKDIKQDDAVELITVEKVAHWAVEHGLANWVIEKAH